MLTDAEIAARYVKIRPYLDERQRRLWLGVEAQALGRAGAGLVARATGADVKTVRRGRDEVEAGLEPDGRVRGPGGGRPSVTDLDGGVLPALEALVDPATRGDPMSPLRWTTKLTAHCAVVAAADAGGGADAQVRNRGGAVRSGTRPGASGRRARAGGAARSRAG